MLKKFAYMLLGAILFVIAFSSGYLFAVDAFYGIVATVICVYFAAVLAVLLKED